VPEAPDPHWRVVDAKGTVYLLDRVKLKDDKINRSIMLSAYVPNVATVQFWWAFVEVVLGEASVHEADRAPRLALKRRATLRIQCRDQCS